MGKVATSPLPPRGSPRLRARGKIRSGPQVGKVATSPLPPRGSPPLQSGGQNQKWPTSGQGGYITPAASGIPTASERGAKSEVAHKWARWLHNPRRLGDPHRLRVGGKIRSGPQVGKVATSPLPPRGSPPLQRRGAQSEVAHKWARWLHHPCCLGDPHRLRPGGKIRSGAQVGKVATCRLGDPHRLRVGGKITPAASGIKAHRLRDTHRYKAGGKIRLGEVAHKWARWLHRPGIPTASERGAKSQVAPSGQGGYITPAASGKPHRLRAGGKITSGPQVGKVATSPLPPRGSPPLQSGGQSQKWPTSGQGGITPAAAGIPTASKQSEQVG